MLEWRTKVRSRMGADGPVGEALERGRRRRRRCGKLPSRGPARWSAGFFSPRESARAPRAAAAAKGARSFAGGRRGTAVDWRATQGGQAPLLLAWCRRVSRSASAPAVGGDAGRSRPGVFKRWRSRSSTPPESSSQPARWHVSNFGEMRASCEAADGKICYGVLRSTVRQSSFSANYAKMHCGFRRAGGVRGDDAQRLPENAGRVPSCTSCAAEKAIISEGGWGRTADGRGAAWQEQLYGVSASKDRPPEYKLEQVACKTSRRLVPVSFDCLVGRRSRSEMERR